MNNEQPAAAEEQVRIIEEYKRRAHEIPSIRYAPWDPAEALARSGRYRIAASLLADINVFPTSESQCLEIGFGTIGWLGELISWGVKETSLHGIELDDTRATIARSILPKADLRTGDATCMPWENDTFKLIITSTVFTSILDGHVRKLLAAEITRVLTPGGALIWYDFKYNNPRNPKVRKVTRKELQELFPNLRGTIKSITLAPPIARFIAPKSWTITTLLEAIPFLRTHLIGVLKK